jgi:hypothetical protein
VGMAACVGVDAKHLIGHRNRGRPAILFGC